MIAYTDTNVVPWCLCSETKDREKVSLLIDFSKYSQSSGILNIRMSLDVLSILSNHYPERLGNAWIIGASWSFTFFWKAVSPFLDPVTKNKIFFIKDNKEFLQWIPEDVLEVEYGGKNDYQYSYEVYKPSQDRLYPPYDENGKLVGADEVEAEEAPKKKSKKSKKAKEHKEEDENVEEAAPSDTPDDSATRKRKKSKKNMSEEASLASEEASAPAAAETKEKKRKDSADQSEASAADEPHSESQETVHKKRSKKNKAAEAETEAQ